MIEETARGAGHRTRGRVGSVVMTVAAAVGCVLVGAAVAGAQVRGTIIGPGSSGYPIAVSPLRASAGETRNATTFADIVAKDLELSGLFRVIDRAAYLEDPQRSGTTIDTIDFRDWQAIGAQALVKGTLDRTPDGMVMEVRLFDVVDGATLGGKRYRADARELRRLAHRFADEVMRVMTGTRGPFESRIAFTSRRGSRLKELYVMSLDGGDLQAVTRESSIVLSPSWSPDGRSLLFTSFQGGNPSLFEIGVSGEGRRLISARGGLNLGGRWSPRGKAIAVTLENQGMTDIALLDPAGELLHFITRDRAIDVSAAWAPDGLSVAFCSDRGGGPQIYVVNANGGTPKRVTFQGSYNTSPAWSPSGDRIAYASRREGRFHVFTTDLNGGDVRRITQGRSDNEDPSWSPDGRYLVFSSTRDGERAIYLADATGRHQRRLTPPGGDDSSPTWSRWLE